MGAIRAWVSQFIFRRLFNGVTERDVLRERGGRLFRRGHQLTDEQERGIISEAESLSQSPLLALLLDELRLAANDNIFNKSSSVGDLVAPKAVLWTVDVLEKKVRALADRRPPAPPKPH